MENSDDWMDALAANAKGLQHLRALLERVKPEVEKVRAAVDELPHDWWHKAALDVTRPRTANGPGDVCGESLGLEWASISGLACIDWRDRRWSVVCRTLLGLVWTVATRGPGKRVELSAGTRGRKKDLWEIRMVPVGCSHSAWNRCRFEQSDYSLEEFNYVFQTFAAWCKRDLVGVDVCCEHPEGLVLCTECFAVTPSTSDRLALWPRCREARHAARVAKGKPGREPGFHELFGDELKQLGFAPEVRIGPHQVDFCHKNARLVVELDGSSHGKAKTLEDKPRDRWIYLNEGMFVLRYPYEELEQRFEACLDEIKRALDAGLQAGSPGEG